MAIYKGNKEIVGLYKGPTEIIKRYKGSNLIYNVFKWLPYSYEHIYNSLVPQYMNKSSVPEEYQEVEYIESTGTQYINSTLIPSATHKFSIRFSVGYLGNCVAFGSRTSGNYDSSLNQIYLNVTNNNEIKLFNIFGTNDLVLNNSVEANTVFTYKNIQNNNCQLSSPTQPYYIFTLNNMGSPSTIANIKMYYFKIYDNNTLVRDFIPCYRKSDNVIGLYDKVNNVFYTNAGTGTFLKGADVKRTVKDKAQVKTIYGDSVVENQLVPNDKIEQVITFETTDTNPKPIVNIDFIVGHKYLITCEQSAALSSNTRNTFTIGTNYETTQSNANLQKGIRNWIYTHSGDGTALYIWCHSPNIQVSFTNFNIIDLSQRHPFNTPTTLADTRVQEIINRGHIPYNAGTLKNVDIGEISSEPYNLLSLNRTAGTYTGNRLQSRGFDESHYYIGVSMNDYTTKEISNVVISENSVTMTTKAGGGYGIGFPVKVIPGQRYSLDIGGSTEASISKRVGFYNENKEYISYAENMTGLGYCDVPFNAHWAVIIICPAAPTQGLTVTITDIAFHLTGTRTGYAPIKTFNLWNEETILALLQYDKNASNFGQQISGGNITSKNYISVLPNKEYSVSGASPQANMVLFCYDENKNAIVVGDKGYTAIANNGQTFTTPNDCRYIRFYMSSPYGAAYKHDICINVSGNKNGTYMPYGVVDNLSLSYQGSGVGTAHDTMEQTGTEYVFTKAMNEYTFTGSESWVAEGEQYYTSLPIQEYIKGVATSAVGNIICCCLTPKNQTALYQGTADNGVAVGSTAQTKVVTVRSSANITSIQTAASYMAGKTIKYQLATPQVVRIPKKHLGVVRIKDLSWSYNSSEANHERFYTTSLSSVIKNIDAQTLGNLYSTHLMTKTDGEVYSHVSNQIIGTHNGTIQVYDKDCSTTQQLLDKYGNDLIFYETENEVADIDLTILVEEGGTLTSNLFSWVENQLSNPTPISQTINGLVFTNNGDGSYTVDGTATADTTKSVGGTFSIISGHYYLICGGASGGSNSTYRLLEGYTYRWNDTDGNGYIQNATAGGNASLIIDIKSGTTCNNLIFKPQFIDLTLGFGAGKEPTSINDPRIQYIIKQGYIPTNTTGTNKSIASEVLPNIDFKMKCR